jgi:hypothetical protein
MFTLKLRSLSPIAIESIARNAFTCSSFTYTYTYYPRVLLSVHYRLRFLPPRKIKIDRRSLMRCRALDRATTSSRECEEDAISYTNTNERTDGYNSDNRVHMIVRTLTDFFKWRMKSRLVSPELWNESEPHADISRHGNFHCNVLLLLRLQFSLSYLSFFFFVAQITIVRTRIILYIL